MRLLELENVNNGNLPQAATLARKAAEKQSSQATSSQPHKVAKTQPRHVFRISGKHALHQTVRRQPIDIEQLQQRIVVLERRMRERARADSSRLPDRDLQQLRHRVKLLERSVHNELWAAKQREHTLLEMLARPPLKHLIRKHAKRFYNHTLRTARRWRVLLGQLNQPLWWPGFARAWQESLDKARGNYNN